MKYYYSINDRQEGPVTLDELKRINISNKTLVWHEGLTDWVLAENIEELNDFFKSKHSPPPLPSKKPPQLPDNSSHKSVKNNQSTHSLLKSFKDEFVDNGIYHSEKQFSNNISTQIAYIKKSKLKWLATQLNTFIVVGATASNITEQLIHDFSDEAFQFAKKNNRGLPRGLHSGIGVIAVLIGKSADFQAKNYCLKLSKHYNAFKIPVIVETENNEIIHFTKEPFWGKMYYPYLKKLIIEYVGNSLL